MKIVIEKKQSGYEMLLEESNKVKRTNKTKTILSIIDEIPSECNYIILDSKEITIVFDDNNKLILKGVKYDKRDNLEQLRSNINSTIFKNILSVLNSETKIIRITKKNNKNKLALLLTTGFILGSFATMGFLITAQANSPKNDDSSTNNQISSSNVEENTQQLISLNDESNYDLITRLSQTKEVQSQNSKYSYNLNDYSTNKIVDFIESDNGKYCFETCADFGVDPYMFICLMLKESSLDHEKTIPGGENYNGYGVGICQLEQPSGQIVTAFNYSTSQEETIEETMENAVDLRTNIKIGIMRYQNVLKKYKGNEKLALQSYNYGKGLVDLIVCIYADEVGKTYEEVVNDFNDTGWMKYVKIAHDNPQGFAGTYEFISNYHEFRQTFDYLKNWNFETYGDDNYVSSVLSHYIGIFGINIIDDEMIEINHKSSEVNRCPYEKTNFQIS